jgi:hypothetical protein
MGAVRRNRGANPTYGGQEPESSIREYKEGLCPQGVERTSATNGEAPEMGGKSGQSP